MAGRLIYSVTCSLDGYVNDESGGFGWAVPDAEVHSFINASMRPVGTFLYGRRLYETMKPWQSDELIDGEPDYVQEFAGIWRAAQKIVYSRTLAAASTPATRLEHDVDTDAIARLKQDASADLTIGGPTLAAHAVAAGLVDEVQLVVAPEIVGGGTGVWPRGVRIGLDLVEERRFESGFVFLRYRADSTPRASID
jgi:dihydrofolate reductase